MSDSIHVRHLDPRCPPYRIPADRDDGLTDRRPVRKSSINDVTKASRPRSDGKSSSDRKYRNKPGARSSGGVNSNNSIVCADGHAMISFPTSAEYRKHMETDHTRPFPCDLQFAGCPGSFWTKNEWKRHLHTQHLHLGFWRCDIDTCRGPSAAHDNPTISLSKTKASHGGDNNKWQPSDFNRKDLFTQHIRRMHMPRDAAGSFSVDNAEFITEAQTRCYKPIRKPPSSSSCLFCERHFNGKSSWEERMEHVGRHWEKRIGIGTLKPDRAFISWLESEGLVKKTGEEKWELVEGGPTNGKAAEDTVVVSANSIQKREGNDSNDSAREMESLEGNAVDPQLTGSEDVSGHQLLRGNGVSVENKIRGHSHEAQDDHEPAETSEMADASRMTLRLKKRAAPKIFECDHVKEGNPCGKRYSRPEFLRRHQLKHSRSAPFQCTVSNCQQEFQREDQLKWHIAREHSAKRNISPNLTAIGDKVHQSEPTHTPPAPGNANSYLRLQVPILPRPSIPDPTIIRMDESDTRESHARLLQSLSTGAYHRTSIGSKTKRRFSDDSWVDVEKEALGYDSSTDEGSQTSREEVESTIADNFKHQLLANMMKGFRTLSETILSGGWAGDPRGGPWTRSGIASEMSSSLQIESLSSSGRKRSRDDRDLSPRDGSQIEDSKRAKIDSPASRQARSPRPFACPCFKHDHAHVHTSYSGANYGSCADVAYKSIGQIKAHLQRSHRVPVHCSRCYRLFNLEEELRQHNRALNCEILPERVLEGIPEEKLNLLLLKSSSSRTTDKERRWKDVYHMLYPDDDIIPGPYYGESDPTLSIWPQENAAFQDYAKHFLPQLVEEKLGSLIDEDLQPIKDKYCNIMPDTVIDCLTTLFQKWQQLSGGSPAATADHALAISTVAAIQGLTEISKEAHQTPIDNVTPRSDQQWPSGSSYDSPGSFSCICEGPLAAVSGDRRESWPVGDGISRMNAVDQRAYQRGSEMEAVSNRRRSTPHMQTHHASGAMLCSRCHGTIQSVPMLAMARVF